MTISYFVLNCVRNYHLSNNPTFISALEKISKRKYQEAFALMEKSVIILNLNLLYTQTVNEPSLPDAIESLKQEINSYHPNN